MKYFVGLLTMLTMGNIGLSIYKTDELASQVLNLEKKVNELKLDNQELKRLQSNLEHDISEAWQKHDDDLYMIKQGLGLNKE